LTAASTVAGLSKAGETAIDVTAYAAHIAAQLGAHIIKVKLPSDHIEQDAARKVYEKQKIPISKLKERVRHVVQCTFDGRRIVIFSGGMMDSDDTLLDGIRAIHAGGGFGSIIGRNSFQRTREREPKATHSDALSLLTSITDIYSSEAMKRASTRL
jgi:fructose-bisphosphate aldolase, class I